MDKEIIELGMFRGDGGISWDTPCAYRVRLLDGEWRLERYESGWALLWAATTVRSLRALEAANTLGYYPLIETNK